MSPTTLADGLFGVEAADDRLRGNETLALPLGEAFAEKSEDVGLAPEVGFFGSGVAADFAGLAIPAGHSFHPADAVEPFLKDVGDAGHEIVVGPAAQPIGPAQRLDRP